MKPRKDSRTVFIVEGSEDGLLAVFSNLTRAYECAAHYLENGADEKVPVEGRVPHKDLKQLRKEFKQGYWHHNLYPKGQTHNLFSSSILQKRVNDWIK